MKQCCSWVWRGTVENEAGNAIDRDWEKRSDNGVSHAKRKPEREAPFIWPGITIETPVRSPCAAHGFPEREFFAFCLAHCRGEVAGADNSVSIASITACVEIWFIGNRGCLGRNSVTGAVDSPHKIRPGLSRGRQWKGFVGPNRITCGVRAAAAKCVGAESTVTSRRALAISAASASRSVLPETSTTRWRTFDLMSTLCVCSSGDEPPVITRSTSCLPAV